MSNFQLEWWAPRFHHVDIVEAGGKLANPEHGRVKINVEGEMDVVAFFVAGVSSLHESGTQEISKRKGERDNHCIGINTEAGNIRLNAQ